jgi:hypothetical protein
VVHKRIKPGDCFAIPLPDGRHAYCKYMFWNDDFGYLIRVFDTVTEAGLPIASDADLQSAGEMFPPVFVGLKAAIRNQRWKFIGNLPVTEFRFPVFRATSATKPGQYDNWWLWDGQERRFIGKLPTELRSLEIEQIWGYELLEERIATGKNPFAGLQ